MFIARSSQTEPLAATLLLALPTLVLLFLLRSYLRGFSFLYDSRSFLVLRPGSQLAIAHLIPGTTRLLPR